MKDKMERGAVVVEATLCLTAFVFAIVEADVRVRPLMITLPIFNEYDNNLQDKKDWCSYKIKAVRGYA